MAKIRFDTKVQFIKYKVLSEIARHAYAGDLNENLLNIPKVISPGPDSSLRCCVYKERAIVSESVQLATQGVKKDENVIEVHIPADGKLSFEECTASFTCARAFFARYFPNFSYRFYSCHSWLLDTSLKRFVGENSNVYLFGARFEEIDKNQDDAILRYVFRWDAKRESLDNFPAKSTLARALKGAVENGEAFYEVLGIIPKENV